MDAHATASAAPRRRLPRWTLVVAAALLLGAAAFLLRPGNLEQLGRRYLNQKLSKTSNIRVYWRFLRGNPLEKVEVAGLRVDVRLGRGWAPFLSADDVTINAGLPQLLKAARLDIQAVNPVVYLRNDTAGKLVLPELHGSGEHKEGGVLEIRDLRLVNATVCDVRSGRPQDWITALTARAQVQLGGNPRIHVKELRGRIPDKGLDVRHLVTHLELDDRGWHWQDLTADGPGFGVSGHGRYSSDRDFNVTAQADSLGSNVVAPWTGARLPESRYRGRVDVEGRGARVKFGGEGYLTHAALGSPHLNFTGDSYHGATRFSRLATELAAGRFTGTGVVGPGARAHFDWQGAGMDPSKAMFLPPDARVARTVAAGAGKVDLTWDPRGVTTVHGTATLGPSTLLGHALSSGETEFAFQDSVWTLQRVVLRGVEGTVEGALAVSHGTALSGRGTAELDLAPLARAADQAITGRLRGRWNLSGTIPAPDASGRVEIQDARWKWGGVDSGYADVTWHGPGPEGLSAEMQLRSVLIGDVRLPAVRLHADGGRETKFHLDTAVGDSSFSADGHVEWQARALALDAASLALGNKRWAQRGITRIGWSESDVTWEGLEWASPDGDSISSRGAYAWGRRGLEGGFTARRWALRPLTAHFLHDSAPEGLLSGSVAMTGTLDHPHLTFDAEVEDGALHGHMLDRLRVVGSLTDGRLEARELEIRKGSSRLAGHWSVDLPDVRARGFKALGDSTRVLFDRAAQEGRIEVQPFDLGELAEYSEGLRYAGGRLLGHLTVGGTLARPTFETRLDGDSVSYRDLYLGRVEIAAHFEDENLVLDTVHTETPQGRSSLAGTLPVRISLQPPAFEPADRPANLEAQLEHADVQLLSYFTQDILAYANGRFSVHATLTGTPSARRLRGEATVEGATFRPAGREEFFRNVTAKVEFQDNVLELRNLHAETGRRGVLEGSGRMTLPAKGQPIAYHLDLTARNATLTDQENYSVLVSGKLGVDPLSERDRYPVVTGALTVEEGLLLMRFGEIPATLQPTHEKPKFRWYYDLGVTVPSDLWWRNDQANIEVSGELRALNTTGQDEGQGSFTIGKGTFDVYDTSFRINDGTVTFNGPVVDPTVALNADANVGAYTIQLSVPGCKVSQLNNPANIVLSSTSSSSSAPQSYSQSDLIGFLTVGRFVGGVPGLQAHASQSAPGAIGSTLGNYALNRLQRALAQGATGLVDVLDVGTNPDATGVDVTRIGVGKYVTPDIFVRYAQGLGATSDRDLSVEWRLNKYFLVRGESKWRPLTSTGTTTTDNESNVDFKMRLDF